MKIYQRLFIKGNNEYTFMGTHTNKRKLRDPRQRFIEKVHKTNNCWVWIGAIRKNGYGSFWSGKKHESAHRFSYKLYNGVIPDRKLIMHICDNKICVNPNHLKIGTQMENLQDMYDKSRDRPPKKLTITQVKEIRLLNKKYSRSSLSKKYNISLSVIGRIIRNEVYII